MKIDYLNISYIEANIDELAKHVFNSGIEHDERWSFQRFKNIKGLAIVEFYNVRQIQMSALFFERENAYEEAQQIYRWLKNRTKTKISRIDIAQDFIGAEVESLVKKKYMHKSFFSRTKSIKTSIIASEKIETFYASTRHFKFRIYDRIKSAQHLLATNKARDIHTNELRLYSEVGLIRVEFELRANYTVYCDKIFLECDADELCKQVLTAFLKEVPFVKENGRDQNLWKQLKQPDLQKIKANNNIQIRNKQEKEKDIRKTASFVANKFKKWGMTNLEAINFLLLTFGFYELEFSFDGQSTSELKHLLAQYEVMFGPLPRSASEAKAG